MRFVRHAISIALALTILVGAKSGLMRKEPAPKSGLRAALEEVLSADRAHRLFVVEEVLRPTFEAFPKNSAGRIVTQSLHSIVRDYFASEHGWLFSGFEFAGTRSTKLEESRLLQSKAPKLVSALKEVEEKEESEGLSLMDTVATVAAVEHLVLEESKALLNRAYSLNEANLTGSLERHQLEEILSSYLMLFRKGKKDATTDVQAHMAAKPAFLKSMEDEGLTAFFLESVDKQRSKSEYAFTDSVDIAQDIALRYGKWQNAECEMMKQALVRIADGSGRVALDVFHSQPKSPHYSFTESADYLRQINSLDESAKDTPPKVLIANYLASPSNCIGWSEYFSVCCLNECDGLVNELEGRVQTTDVPVDKLIEAVSAIQSGTVSVPRQLPERLAKLAREVASVHGGVMPMQSGDFRRWFHFAFPNECPYPTDVEAQTAEGERDATEKWLDTQRALSELSRVDYNQEDVIPAAILVQDKGSDAEF